MMDCGLWLSENNYAFSCFFYKKAKKKRQRENKKQRKKNMSHVIVFREHIYKCNRIEMKYIQSCMTTIRILTSKDLLNKFDKYLSTFIN